jgi:hypothetical protein
MANNNEKITPISDYQYQKEVYEHERQIYEDNMRLWESYNQTCTAMDARFDKALFAIAAGSFGISFAFIDKFVDIAQAVYPTLLIASWACFAGCLIVMVIGHLLSAESYRRLRDEVARNMLLQYDGKSAKNKPLRDIVSPCNYIALVSYVGGIICLLLFVPFNL